MIGDAAAEFEAQLDLCRFYLRQHSWRVTDVDEQFMVELIMMLPNSDTETGDPDESDIRSVVFSAGRLVDMDEDPQTVAREWIHAYATHEADEYLWFHPEGEESEEGKYRIAQDVLDRAHGIEPGEAP